MAIIDDNQFVEVDDRAYVNPQVALDEANQFIDKLRSIQQGNNQQIQTQTYNLGTEVPSNLGGLVGGESYFSSRYQTPQTVSATANLRAAAQAAALNQVLADEQAIWKNRYQQAYKNYQSRQNAKANSYYSGGGGGDENIEQTTTTYEVGDVETEGISKHMYQRLFDDYIKQGLSAQEAEIMAKQALGVSANAPSDLGKTKTSIRGRNNDYVYTLPNGNTVLVDEDSYRLVNAGDQYFLQDLNTKSLTRVGG